MPKLRAMIEAAEKRRSFVDCLRARGYTYQQIGERLGVTRARASQIAQKSKYLRTRRNLGFIEMDLAEIELGLIQMFYSKRLQTVVPLPHEGAAVQTAGPLATKTTKITS